MDPIQAVVGSYRDPIQTAYDPIGIRYRLYAILLGPDTDCIAACRGPIQTV